MYFENNFFICLWSNSAHELIKPRKVHEFHVIPQLILSEFANQIKSQGSKDK